MKFFILSILLLAGLSLSAQRKRDFVRTVHFSIAPALGSNGFHPGGYTNYFSLHVTSGYAAASYLLEIAGISNLNVNETRGLQFAGLTNITGANAFAGMSAKEVDKLVREGFEPNLSGIQVSGITNVVLNNVFGAQFTGGVNVAGGALQGLQISGVGNMVTKYTFGIQLGGVFNMSVASMDGLQLSSLYNMTKNELFGVQLSAFNVAGVIHGKNSYENNDPTGVQIGLINRSRVMNGFQIGMINIGKTVQGTQIGLINFYSGGKTPQTRDGTSIGLVNIGSTGYFAVYTSELFTANVEVATGTNKNRRMSGENTTREIVNALIYGKNPGGGNEWMIGYGLRKKYLNRSSAPGFGHIRFLMFGVDALHYNHSSSLTRELSLIARPNVSAGSRFHPKNRNFFFFATLAYNVYFTDTGRGVRTLFIDTSDEEGDGLLHWPGFSAGVLVR